MKYNIIATDPPWGYRDKCHSGKRGAGYKYNTMTIQDIQAMPIQSIATADCALFLWVTAPMFDIGIDTLKGYGFEYKTIAFTWIKRTKNWKLHWGMGSYTRANPEYCLLGIKGKPKRLSAAVHSVIEARVREHSRKPDEARERMVQLYGDVPRIELFARERVDGWHAWGNEVESDIDI